MQGRKSRREFLKAAGACATALTTLELPQLWAISSPANRNYRKAVKFGMVHGDGSVLEKFQLLRKLGFDGVEVDSPTNLSLNELVEAQQATGVAIHGVVDSVHWSKPFSHADAAVRAEGGKALETAVHDCKALGGSTVLVVPGIVNERTSYEQAYDRSQNEIRKIVPMAEELGIQILFENVWNHFLLSPLEAATYVDEFESDAVGWYFDVGNVIRYAWPVHWIETLGKRIKKLDIKEYSRTKRDQEGLWKGFEVELLEGDCDWPQVMAALDKVGFFDAPEGSWGTAEIRGGDEQRLTQIAQNMDRIFQS